jgi:hypothetical protein
MNLNEKVVAYSQICTYGMRKTIKPFKTVSVREDSNLAPPEYEPGVLSSEPICSVHQMEETRNQHKILVMETFWKATTCKAKKQTG